ncbi:MAG: DinB family protein [Saprospiraceae bacterium]|uniref:DinB family protein n=1 Tax=Candidatus Opimibacter skivensis TaxID=2982028 RepID=A0A9D7SR48_9BACT|nr:DinB family protein [Candidatus Opimibacter skivensis]
MKDFLIEMFDLNQEANIKLVSAIKKLADQDECLKHLSHLANCQYKWLDRILIFPNESELDWWEPVYNPEELAFHFKESTQRWISYLSDKSDDEIESMENYRGYDGSIWEASLKDIALQLVFHSFHHRAQIQMMIRAQGQKPGFIDYIGYKQKKTGRI